MKKQKTLLTAISLMLIAALAVGGTLAYLTTQDSKTNNFTIGSFNTEDGPEGDTDVVVEEPGWDALPDEDNNDVPDAAENLRVGSNVAKDPQVVNYSTTQDAYVFLKVDVPTVTKGADGTVIAATDLFALNDKSSQWTLVKETRTDGTNGAPGVHTYIYAYTGSSAAACEVLAKDTSTQNTGNKTPALFQSVTLNNVFLDDLAGKDADGQQKKVQINITGYSIQTGLYEQKAGSTELDTTKPVTAPAAVWNIISNQKSLNLTATN